MHFYSSGKTLFLLPWPPFENMSRQVLSIKIVYFRCTFVRCLVMPHPRPSAAACQG